MFKEFKQFAFKGNVVDMAVGVMIGGAFGQIVSSAVNDLFMPLVSLLTGGLDFSNLFIAFDGFFGVHGSTSVLDRMGKVWNEERENEE